MGVEINPVLYWQVGWNRATSILPEKHLNHQNGDKLRPRCPKRSPNMPINRIFHVESVFTVIFDVPGRLNIVLKRKLTTTGVRKSLDFSVFLKAIFH